MEISSDLFEAHLKCPTKCWLRANGEQFAGNAYAQWVRTQSDTYCAIKLKQLEAKSPSRELVVSPPTANMLGATWRYATRISLRAATNTLALRSELHALERQPARTDGKTSGIVPIRFVFTNKLGKDERMLLGFDALVLSISLGQKIEIGKIIHGDHGDTTRVNISHFLDDTNKRIDKIVALLSNSSPPELVLNRHCSECEFQYRCHEKAVEVDDLSLLSGLSEKERARHRSKGIFTVAQLSYTFRPRRTPKRSKNPSNPHHFALQALAIREKCVYIHGTPEIPESKCAIFLDIEGLPDREFYYLIGALVVSDGHESFHSFWADTELESQRIFHQFADLTDMFKDYRVFHYGDYDSTAIKRIAASMPLDAQERFNSILQKSVNILSVVFPHVYFPSYSNGLKAISPLVCSDSEPSTITGLDSIIWRMNWESSNEPHLKEQLLEYNRTDCYALKRVSEFIARRVSTRTEPSGDAIVTNMVDEQMFARQRWELFKKKPYAIPELEQVIPTAYFDYQREKVFIRTHPQFKAINKRVNREKSNFPSRPNRTVNYLAKSCPFCRGRKLTCIAETSHFVADLKFYSSGVRRYVTRYVSFSQVCEKCNAQFRAKEWSQHQEIIGHGLASWSVYQNNVLGVNILKVRKALVDCFGLHVEQQHLYRAKNKLASFYEPLYAEILDAIVASPVLHIDETTVRLRKVKGYVWVLTTFNQVYYIYRPTREAEFLKEILVGFRGVIVSDFFTGYDSLPCQQQKCIIHFVRDIDDDLIHNPFDEELKRLAQSFGILLRSIVATVDRFGLRCLHLRKHIRDVTKFMKEEVAINFKSELARKYAKRLSKYGARMFTFLDHDGVPWNNNNAEHAIKRFAKYRRYADGLFTEKTLKGYLILASVFETCDFDGVNVLKFLLSKEQTLEGLQRMAGQKRNRGDSSLTGTIVRPPLH